MDCSHGIGPLEALALAEGGEEEFLGDPVEAVDAGQDVALEIVEDFAPGVGDPADFVVLLAMLAGGLEVEALDVDGGDFAAVAQLDDPVVILVAGDGFGGFDGVREFDLRGRGPVSMSSSTSAVVPIFSAVANSLMFESPMMTWKRRKRVESACGSSRVLTSGRRFIVSMLTSSVKKSDALRNLEDARAGRRSPPLPRPSCPRRRKSGA